MSRLNQAAAASVVLLAIIAVSAPLLSIPALAVGPVTFDNSAMNKMGCNAIGIQVLDVAIAIGVGANRMVVAFVTTTAVGPGNTVQFNGVDMTPIASTGGLGVFQHSYYALAPASGAGTLHVDTTPTGQFIRSEVAMSFSGVSQTIAPTGFDHNGFGASPVVFNDLYPTTAGMIVSSETALGGATTPVNALTGGANTISGSYWQAGCLETTTVSTLVAVAGNTAVDWTATAGGDPFVVADAAVVLLSPVPATPGPGPVCEGLCASNSNFLVVPPPTLVQCGAVTLVDNRSQSANAILYTWDFGDGSGIEQTTSHSVSHTYGAGTYGASVSVQDAGGAISKYDVSVTVPSSGACVVGAFVEQFASAFAATIIIFVLSLAGMYLSKLYDTRLFKGVLGATVVLVSLIVLFVAPVDAVKLAALSSTALAGTGIVLAQVSGYGKRFSRYLAWYGIAGAVLVAALFL